MEVTFLTNHNNNFKWPNTSTHVVCWRRREYSQLPLNLATQNPFVFVSKLYFLPVFYFFIVRKVNLKLVLFLLSFMGLLSIYVQSRRVSYLASSSCWIRRFCCKLL